MGAFGGIILTNRGRNLQTKAQTGVRLNFTRMGIGDGSLGSSSILELNSLKNERKSLPLTKLRPLSSGQAILGSVLTNQDISSGFYFREIGVFAMDPDVGEILYCYGNAGNTADYIPAGSAGSSDILERTIDIGVIVGNAANVTATINQSLVFETPEGAQQKAKEAEEAAKAHAKSALEEHLHSDTPHQYIDTNGSVVKWGIGIENGVPFILTRPFQQEEMEATFNGLSQFDGRIDFGGKEMR